LSKAALITGGAKRIGRQIALYLANQGFDIAVHYNRSVKDAEQVAEEIRSMGRECSIFQADLTGREQVVKLADDVFEKFSEISLLINNASLFERAGFLQTDEALFEKLFSANFRAPFLLMQKFGRHANDKNIRLQIINILDAKISRNHTPYFWYSLTKKSLADLTLMAAKALGPNVRVNGISPGLILPSKDSGEEGFLRMKENIPLKMTGNPDYITHAIGFLLDNPFVTGEILFIDGGEHLGL